MRSAYWAVALNFFGFRTICLYGIQYQISFDKDYSDTGYIQEIYFKNTCSAIEEEEEEIPYNEDN
jgi:hypothetical protein